MKNRFNWNFELLKAQYIGVQAEYLRGSDPDGDARTLLDALHRLAHRARERQREFPGEEQYLLWLTEYVEIIEDVLGRARQGGELEPLLAEGRERITALQDDIRLHLK
jgi:hypothetical protein